LTASSARRSARPPACRSSRAPQPGARPTRTHGDGWRRTARRSHRRRKPLHKKYQKTGLLHERISIRMAGRVPCVSCGRTGSTTGYCSLSVSWWVSSLCTRRQYRLYIQPVPIHKMYTQPHAKPKAPSHSVRCVRCATRPLPHDSLNARHNHYQTECTGELRLAVKPSVNTC
jgi:hypothetical protein